MTHQDSQEAFLMSSEIEDDLVVPQESLEPSNPSTSTNQTPANIMNDIDTEMVRILNTPWYELTPDQAEVVHRLVEITSSEHLTTTDLRNSIEDSLVELAMIRGRNAQVAQQSRWQLKQQNTKTQKQIFQFQTDLFSSSQFFPAVNKPHRTTRCNLRFNINSTINPIIKIYPFHSNFIAFASQHSTPYHHFNDTNKPLISHGNSASWCNFEHSFSLFMEEFVRFR